MKLLPEPINCERCGDEILPSEQSRPDDRICPWCRHMMLESIEIHQQAKSKRDSHLILLDRRN